MKEVYMTQDQARQQFSDALDKVYGTVNVCGVEYPAAFVYAHVDEASYLEDLKAYAAINNIRVEG